MSKEAITHQQPFVVAARGQGRPVRRELDGVDAPKVSHEVPAEIPHVGLSGGEPPAQVAGVRVPCCGLGPPLAPLPPPQVPRDVQAAPPVRGGNLHDEEPRCLVLLFRSSHCGHEKKM